MTAKFVVTDEQERVFHKRRREIENRLFKNILNPENVNNGLQLLIEGHKIVIDPSEDLDNWLQSILNREHQCHLNFFGRNFNLSEFKKTLKKYGQKKIEEWQKLGLKPHFLPDIILSQDNDLPRWKVKPENWYYQQAGKDKILHSINGKVKVDKQPYELEGITVLIETRLKPAFDNGKQMYEYDCLLGSVIMRLRKDEKIAKYEHGLQSSRFGVSADEWEIQIKQALAKELGFEASQIRLERAIEANIFPQLYSYMPRRDDGNTNTWVWYEEFFGDRGDRLLGGHSGYGGLAHIGYYGSDDRWYDGSFRPLAVL